MKPHPTITQRIAANPRAVGRVTPCAPLLASRPTSYPGCHFPIALLLRNTLCKCLLLQHVTFVAKAPKMRVASPLASLSPQRGEGLRVRGGHIQSRLPFLPVSAPSGVPAEHLKLNTENSIKTPEISLFTFYHSETDMNASLRFPGHPGYFAVPHSQHPQHPAAAFFLAGNKIKCYKSTTCKERLNVSGGCRSIYCPLGGQ